MGTLVVCSGCGCEEVEVAYCEDCDADAEKEASNIETEVVRLEKELREAYAYGLSLSNRVAKLRTALKRISDEDFRGNRPWSSVVAFEALKKDDKDST